MVTLGFLALLLVQDVTTHSTHNARHGGTFFPAFGDTLHVEGVWDRQGLLKVFLTDESGASFGAGDAHSGASFGADAQSGASFGTDTRSGASFGPDGHSGASFGADEYQPRHSSGLGETVAQRLHRVSV